jgi:hypothetical protein
LADGDGATAASVQRKIQSPCNAAGRRGGGDVVNGDAGRCRAKVLEWCRSLAAFLLCPSVQRGSAGAEEQRKKKVLWG